MDEDPSLVPPLVGKLLVRSYGSRVFGSMTFKKLFFIFRLAQIKPFAMRRL
jgi:hypothetical protein